MIYNNDLRTLESPTLTQSVLSIFLMHKFFPPARDNLWSFRSTLLFYPLTHIVRITANEKISNRFSQIVIRILKFFAVRCEQPVALIKRDIKIFSLKFLYKIICLLKIFPIISPFYRHFNHSCSFGHLFLFI